MEAVRLQAVAVRLQVAAVRLQVAVEALLEEVAMQAAVHTRISIGSRMCSSRMC